MTAARISGVVLRRLVIWVMLEAGLDPEQLPQAFALDERDPSRTSGTFRFQAAEAEAEPVAEAAVTLSPGDSAKLVGLSVDASTPALRDRFETLLRVYAANPDGETYREQKSVEARNKDAWDALDRALEAAGLAPIEGDRRERGLDDAHAQVLMQIHLATGRARPPASFVEWSVALDLDDLSDALTVVGSTVQQGMGAGEVAEVLGVVEEMRVDQTRTFRFPVSVGGRASEVWVSVFLDDVDSPDVYVFAEPDLVARIEADWSKSASPRS